MVNCPRHYHFPNYVSNSICSGENELLHKCNRPAKHIETAMVNKKMLTIFSYTNHFICLVCFFCKLLLNLPFYLKERKCFCKTFRRSEQDAFFVELWRRCISRSSWILQNLSVTTFFIISNLLILLKLMTLIWPMRLVRWKIIVVLLKYCYRHIKHLFLY